MKVCRNVIIYTRSIIELQIRFGWWNLWGILVEVHAEYMVETSSWWVGTYMRCIVHDVGCWVVDTWLVHTWYMVGCTCLWYMLITGCLVQVGAWLMHLFMVQVDYRLRYRLMHCSGLLVQFIAVYFIVIVWQWFHHSTSTSGRLDGAMIGGFSHLPVVTREHREL